MAESCVETSQAPEWLSELEKRRELMSKGKKLGHESGAGAPCKECGSKCPGLDLHFWRKVCRNCKCRKDQHDCPLDDDSTGWAQFEVLGQTRSKPAYIKISKIAENPVQLDWVPPNVVEPELIADYMNQLKHEDIPISGTEAAARRKQALAFQLPAHDVDPNLCDNLTDKEREQFQKYVESIRENFVGQGNVTRLGEKQQPFIGYVTEEDDDELPPPPSPIVDKNPFQTNHCRIEEMFNPDGSLMIEKLVPDKLAEMIMNSEMVKNVREMPMAVVEKASVHSNLPEMIPDFIISPYLKQKDKLKDMKINTTGIRSAVLNGPIYDRLFQDLQDRNINFGNDPILGPISKFRNKYKTDEAFQNDANNFVNNLDPNYEDYIELPANGFVTLKGILATPSRLPPTQFNSPAHVKQPTSARFGSIMNQETPMRKLKLPSSFNKLYDPVFPIVSAALENPASFNGNSLIIQDSPLVPDYPLQCKLTPNTKQKLTALGMNSDTTRSGVINGPKYDQILQDLRRKRIRFGDDKILGPMESFIDEYLTNPDFKDEVNAFTLETAQELPGQMAGSKSNDSGFGSIPPTPNFSTYPGMSANAGRFGQIPGIEDMNMYPVVETPKKKQQDSIPEKEGLVEGLAKLKMPKEEVNLLQIKCRQCEKEIHLGEVVVKAERAGEEMAWHPQCFVCHKCNDLLADLVYFFHGGHVYCARDLAVILKIPRCKACDELIFTNEYTAAENTTFHIKHFCCYQCDIPLAGKKYIPDEKTNMPLCLNCFNEFHADKCHSCKRIIEPTEQGVSWKHIHWHGNCFKCEGKKCGKSLIGSRFCVKEEMLFCSADCVQSVLTT